MTKINLKSKIREVVGKNLNRYRKEGLVPAVIYGHKSKPESLWVNLLDFSKIYEKAGENTIIELDIEGGRKVNALINDTQAEPLSGRFLHIDFFQVRMDEKVEADIPLEFVGEAPAVKELGGVLLKNMDAVPVSCLPGDLPAKIEIDISVLKTFDDHVKIKDLKISDKVKILLEDEAIITGVMPPRTEEELSKLNEKVEEDVTKVEGVVKETPAAEGQPEEGKEKAEKGEKGEKK